MIKADLLLPFEMARKVESAGELSTLGTAPRSRKPLTKTAILPTLKSPPALPSMRKPLVWLLSSPSATLI